MNELKRHKKSDKVKWVLTVITLFLVIVMITGICLQLFGVGKQKPSEWFEKTNAEEVASGNALEYSSVVTTLSSVVPISVQSHVSLSESDIQDITGLFGVEFFSTEYLSFVSSKTTVKNNVNDKLLTSLDEFVFFSGRVDESAMFIGSYVLIPRSNIFEDLSNLSFLSVEVSVNGTSVSLNECINDEYYLVGFDNSLMSGVIPFESLSITYLLVNEEVLYPLPPDPIEEGHSFVGWYYGEGCGETECVKYLSETITSDTSIHAHFVVNKFNVTFNSNGGTDVETKIVNWNTSVTLPVSTRVGYTFQGWYLPDGSEYIDQPIKAETELTARWDIIMCTVTFYVNGKVYDTKEVEYGSMFADVVDLANTMNLQVMSLSFSDNTSINGVVDEVTTVVDDLDVTATIMKSKDKIVNTVKNNKWTIVGGLVGIVVLIVVVMGISGSVKRKKR